MTGSERNDEFPPGAADPPDPVSRRQFLAVMGASAALAAGCTRPPRQQIVPYVRQPEGVVPGRPRFYATSMTLAGFATGLLVESHEGRPTKVEGNELHPASLGATDAFAQAAILTLYDPDRSQVVMRGDRPGSWAEAVAALRAAVAGVKGKPGHPLRILTEAVTSPTFARQMELLAKAIPEARWHQYEPVGRSAVREGARRAFGAPADPVYHLDGANVILSLDADFLASGTGHLRYAREFAGQRRVWEKPPAEARMNRLYAVGPTPTPTGATADHRLALKAGDVGAFAAAVAARLGVPGVPLGAGEMFPEDWLAGLAADLGKYRGSSLVIVGDGQPAEVHTLTHAINAHLQNVGKTVTFVPPVHANAADEMGSLRELVEDMGQGRVGVLVVLGANPAFTAPADVEFAREMANVPFRLHLGLYHDETAKLCQWHVPGTHFLEEWGDARAFDGTASIIQPLIAPLYGGVSALQLVTTLRGQERADYDVVREFWRDQWKDDFERRWNTALQGGVIEGTAFAPQKVELKKDWLTSGGRQPPVRGGLEIVFRADPTIYDGRFANNGWLQELPKPLTKITWDGVAVVGPATARELGLTQEVGDRGGDVSVDLVELHYRGRSVEAPVWIQPGHAEGSATVYFGNGRSAAGRVGSAVGFDAYAIRTSGQPWIDSGLEARKTGRRHRLATTQLHHVIHGNDIVRHSTLRDYQAKPAAIATRHSLPMLGEPPSLYPEHRYAGRKWGMVIDLTACTGCGACVVACQAENNIPVVGKEQVARGREMHWLRIDAYHTGDGDNPGETFFQPVPCMHCETAPCEYVCPVNATVHSDEGLNDMVYNRCVGTRYCSNNCPYKVRRFNFFQYADWTTESLKPMRNPDVTVRSRGVMEKCTYCVQRIRAAEIHAELDGRPEVRNREGELVKPIHPHELLTACQAACPSEAIVFGDLNDEGSTIARMRYGQPLNYGLLADELGTRPRTTYLAALRNPNESIQSHS